VVLRESAAILGIKIETPLTPGLRRGRLHPLPAHREREKKVMNILLYDYGIIL
jgi:hypothetical protein